MKITECNIIHDNLRVKEFKLTIRFGFIFYKYKEIIVTFYYTIDSTPYIHGLDPIDLFFHNVEIESYCQDYYKNKIKTK